ncbi:MAG: metalloprotease PmbA [Pseudomonadota bacterium]|nr:metalloprotease PmbA [Pseudomonadota bacterium]
MKYSRHELEDFCQSVLMQAKQLGATDAEVSASCDVGFSASARLGAVENIEHHQDYGLGLTVYVGQKTGTASSSDLSSTAVSALVSKAIAIAKHTQDDPFNGLADEAWLATSIPDLSLDHPWSITPQEAIELAIACEQHALDYDPRITNSEGVSFNTGRELLVYANSRNFKGGYHKTMHQASCSVVAKVGDSMQRDYDYTIARDANDLMDLQRMAEHAAEKTVQRLGATKINTCKVPVILRADMARSVWRSLLQAISGSAIYRHASFLEEKLGQRILPEFVTLSQRPHLLKGLASEAYDDDGVATRDIDFIHEGVFASYIMGTYSARKLGLRSTGNAGGNQNILITHSDKDLNTLCREMGKGLLVTEMIGQGINIVTGDYSRGAFGFWVENGIIQHPVEGITIAGNLNDMLANLVAIGNDVDIRSAIQTGSILLAEMTIAGE